MPGTPLKWPRNLLNRITSSKQFIFFLFFIGTTYQALSQSLIVLRSSYKQEIKPGKLSQIYNDPLNKLTITDVLKGKAMFMPSNQTIINPKSRAFTTWVRFKVKNTIKIPYTVVINESIADTVSYYIVNRQGEIVYQRIKTASAPLWIGPNEIPSINYGFQLMEDNQEYTYYLKIYQKSPKMIDMSINTYEETFRHLQFRLWLISVFLGGLFFLIIYNFLFMLSYEERSKDLIYYPIYLFIVIVMMLHYTGVDNFLPADYKRVSQWMYVPLVCFSNIFILLFSSHFLQFKKNAVKLTWVVNFLVTLNGIVFLLYSIGAEIRWAISLLYILTSFTCLIGGIIGVRNKYQPARFYVIGYGCLIVSIWLSILTVLDVLPPTSFTRDYPIFGTFFMVLFFALAFSDKGNELIRERNKAKEDNIKILENQKETLAAEVEKQTQELQEKYIAIFNQHQMMHNLNILIKKQYQELIDKNMEIAAQNEEIAAQNEELMQGREQMESTNQYLEEIVQRRTEELEQTIGALQQHNRDLMQFSYIISHNLRTPVAQILGLIDIIDPSHLKQNDDIIRHLRTAAANLDETLFDLNAIISIKDSFDKIKEMVPLYPTIEQVLEMLSDDIKSAQAEIIVVVPQNIEILSIKSYLQSILHNLCSNAIKYRSPQRPLKIWIEAHIHGGILELSVRDNGLGIDLEKVSPQKIFGLYKRAHFHVSGKGIGMFLVKTQTEALGGEITLESQLNVGTTFKIILPVEEVRYLQTSNAV